MQSWWDWLDVVGTQSPLRGASLKMTLEETLGTEHDLLRDFLPLPQVTEQEVQGVHWDQLSTLGHLAELHTEDSTLAPSHFSWLTKHILLLAGLVVWETPKPTQ